MTQLFTTNFDRFFYKNGMGDDHEDDYHDSSFDDQRDEYTHMLKSHLGHSSSLQIPAQQA